MKQGVIFSGIFSILSSASAATRVAVVELGKGGAVKRTTSCDSLTTVAGVASLWSALHSPFSLSQHAGMALVPDLFRKVDDGMIVGLIGDGVDLDVMPFVKSLLYGDRSHCVVGQLEVRGKQGEALLSMVTNPEDVNPSAFAPSLKRHAKVSGLTGMMTRIERSDSATIDQQLRDLITILDVETTAAGKTIVLHLVVEEEEESARRRLLSRRLEDEEGEKEEGNEGEDENAAVNNDGNAQQNNGYYGYGYYNSYGEWVTPYKTMFQIQYFNVVLWTSIGLAVILFLAIYLMMYMPLMPDTLLFGESAKLVGDD